MSNKGKNAACYSGFSAGGADFSAAGLLTPVLILMLAGAATSASAQAEAPKLETQIQTGATPAVSAADTAAKEGTAAAAIEESGPELKITFAPYVWMTSMSGTTTVRDIPINFDVSFLDILDDSDLVLGLMGVVDLQYDRFVFQFNGAWATADASNQRSILRDGELRADTEVNLGWLELFGGYRLIDTPIGSDAGSHRRFALDGFIGGRVTLMDLESTLTASADITLPDGSVLNPSESRSASEGESWFEPFVGARIIAGFSEGWTLSLRGDVGGFGWGSDFAWQAMGGLGYTWYYNTWNFSAFAGYRALGQDYSDGEFGWDVITYGPIIGVAFTW